MHITPPTKAHEERVFALQMLFLGLSVLLGLVVVIQYGSPGHRMNADGIYSADPMYGVQRYPRPVSDFLSSRSASARSVRTAESERSAAASERSASSVARIRRASSSRATEERVLRREERTRQEQRSSRPRSAASSERYRFAPGWFWR